MRHIMIAALAIFGLVLVSWASQADAYGCNERCSGRLSTRLAQCDQENFSYLSAGMVSVCKNQAQQDYSYCTQNCYGNTIGPRRMPQQQVEPLPGYSPSPMPFSNFR